MNKTAKNGVLDTVLMHKKKSIVFILLCVLCCELPLLLAMLGFGGLSWASLVAPISPLLQTIGLTVGILGLLAICGYFAYRVYAKAVT